MINKNKSNKIDYIAINNLIRNVKKCVNILFLLLIVILFFIVGKLLIDYKILIIIKKLLKVISPLFIGFIIAWLLNPIVDFLEKKEIKRKISTLIVFFLFIIIVILFFCIIIPEIGKQIQDAIGFTPNILDRFNNYIDTFFTKISGQYDYDFSKIKESIYTTILSYSNSITEELPKIIISSTSTILSSSLKFIIGLFIGFYTLMDFKNIKEKLLKILPNKSHNLFIEIIDKIDNSLRKYVIGTLFVTITLFLFQSLGFFISGLKAPLVFGIICAITNIIPYIGPYIGGIPAILVGFTISPLTGTLTLISVLISQFIESYILTPIILSKTMKLHPVTIIVGLLVFEYYFGVIGLIISTPVISCLKIIIELINEKYKIFEKE